MSGAAKVPAPLLLSLPALLLIWLCYLLPVLYMAAISLFGEELRWRDGTLAHYGELFADPYNLQVILRTFKLSAGTTLITLVLAYPVALFMRQVSPRLQSILSLMVLAPLIMSVVVRTLCWIVLLGPQGVVNDLLTRIGITGVELMYNQTAVLIGLSHVYLSYMILSIATSTLTIDENLMLAASNLGASSARVLWHVILPLSLPGILVGSVLVFTMAASSYATPVLLGGSKAKVMAPEIYDLAINYLNWPAAAAMAVVLFVMSALAVAVGTALLEPGKRHGIAR